MIRAVLDANILVSAVLKKSGNAYQVVAKGANTYQLLTSEFILEEVIAVLQRKHIQSRYSKRVTPQRRTNFFKRVLRVAEQIQVTSRIDAVSEDPQDNPIVACAVDGKAQYLVTGDLHLHRLAAFRKIQIVTPAQFLGILSLPKVIRAEEATRR